MAGQSTPATTLLNRCGVGYRLHTYIQNSRANSYGTEAAEALDLAPEQVFKTLIAELDGRLIVAVVPVGAQLDVRALATAMGAKKCRMTAVTSGWDDWVGGERPVIHAAWLTIPQKQRPVGGAAGAVTTARPGGPALRDLL
jgi:hypothetical protein